ncbi:MAG TPA: hypothetical protein VIH81_10325 [Roseiarcus sp.]|jgi:hypothetical protein
MIGRGASCRSLLRGGKRGLSAAGSGVSTKGFGSLRRHPDEGVLQDDPASLAGKTVNKTQGEIVALEMVERHRDGPAAMLMLLKFIEAHERAKRRARRWKAK